jgi:hypothetical protein
MNQMNRKQRSFEQIKAEQHAKEVEARGEHLVEVAEGVFVDDRYAGGLFMSYVDFCSRKL